MDNASLPSDVLNNVTTTSSKNDDEALSLYMANIRDLALKIIYIIIGTVGVMDNLFVLVVFILFIKITNKVTCDVIRIKCLHVQIFLFLLFCWFG